MSQAFSLIDEEGTPLFREPVGLPHWTERAACASGGHLLDDFFAEETSDGQPTEQVYAAKRRCYSCPVRRECLKWAFEVETGDEYRSGIFGGCTPTERDFAIQAEDPVSFGMKVLDEQVRLGFLMTPISRFVEVVRVTVERRAL